MAEMKPIKVLISDDTEVLSAIRHLESQIPASTKSTPDYLIMFPKVESCIENFSEKSKRLAKNGTTIHVEKEFNLPGSTISVILQYPKKRGFIEKLMGILGSK